MLYSIISRTEGQWRRRIGVINIVWERQGEWGCVKDTQDILDQHNVTKFFLVF